MRNSKPGVGQWLMAIAGLTALALISSPVQAQERTETDDLRVEQNSSVEIESEVEVESDVYTLEQTEVQTIEVQSVEVEQETVELEAVDVETTTSQVVFSETVQVAVFEAIARTASVSVDNLRIVEVSRRSWNDGCLGLSLDAVCTQVITPGYLVTVTNGEDIWVYRTNESGTVAYLDENATEMQVAQFRVRQTQVSFSDVSADYWAARYIRELAALDIIAGYPDGLYRPNKAVTRAEFAAILRRAFDLPKVRNTVKFVDVDQDYWAITAIDEAYTMGFLNSIDTNEFRPLAELYRGDVMFAIARGLNIAVDEDALDILDDYSDVTVSSTEARLLLAALASEGIIVNYPNVQEFSLERVATRAEVAVLVYQALYSMGYVARIDSPYVVVDPRIVVDVDTDIVREQDNDDYEGWDDDDRDDDGDRQNCNQGIGNGAEGCDPGNSQPHGSSNDETGRTPGNRP